MKSSNRTSPLRQSCEEISIFSGRNEVLLENTLYLIVPCLYLHAVYSRSTVALGNRFPIIHCQISEKPMNRSVTALFILFLLATSFPAEAQESQLKYTTNLTFKSDDGQFKVKLGGRMHNQYTWWSADSDYETAGANPEDGAIFRRARLYMSGTIYGNIDFKAQYDFAGGDADFKDLYMEMRDIPRAGAIRVGQFKEPFGLEAQTSSNYSTFVERSSGTVAIGPGRSTGIMAHDVRDDEKLTWWLGAYRPSDNDGDAVGDNPFSFTGRITYLPWESEDRENLLHLGFAASIRNPDGDTLSYTADPEARPAVDFLDTGSQAVEKVTLLGFEAATVHGPFSAQAEYMIAQNRRCWRS